MPLQNTFVFDVDFKIRTLINEPQVTQNDDVKFILNVFDDGLEVDLSSVSTFTLASVRPDKVSVMTLGNKSGDNQVIFELGSTELLVPGTVEAAIQFYDMDGRVSTLPFTFKVLKDPVKNYIPSEDDQTLIELVLGRGPAILDAAEKVTEDTIKAEALRLDAERARITTENKRIEDESARITSENERSLNENLRAEAEALRQTAEGIRIQAEEERQSNTATAIQNVENVITEATEATNEINLVLPNVINLEFIAPYNLTTQYLKNNIVRHGKNSYIALQDTKGNEPTGTIDSPFWGVIAIGGVDGTGTGTVTSVNGVSPVDGNVTITIPDPDLSSYVTKEEIEATPPVLVEITRGSQVVTVPKDSPVNVIDFYGKTVVNHAPLFDSGLWYSTDTITLNSPSKITFTGLSTKAVSYRLEIPLKPNTTYTFSCITNGYVSATIATDNTFAQHRVMINRLGGTFTFTTSATETIARFWLSNQDDLSVNYAGTFTFENVMLNEGATAQEFVANVKGVTNPTIEVKGLNLVPPLSQWEPSSLPTFLRSVSENELVIESTTRVDFATRGVYVSLLPNTEYVFSVELETSNFVTNDVGGYYNLIEHLKDGTTIDHSTPPFHTTNGKVTLSKKITTHSDTARVRLIVGGYSFTGKLAIRNAMLNVGPVAKPFEPYQSDTLTYVGTFHEGDEVNGNTVIRTKREIILDGKENWYLNHSASAYKRVGVNVLTNYFDHWASTLAKFNGKILGIGGVGSIDTYTFEGTNTLLITIPNSDSGWGESYAPTPDEIKAYFMGWKMYAGTVNATTLYNGTGIKAWAKKDLSTQGYVSGSGVTSLPTTQNELLPNYRLLYDLATPVKESVNTIGSLTLAKGDNVVEVTAGGIAREKVEIIFDSGTYQMNNTFSANPLNLFKHRAGTLLNVYKNGVIDINNWTYYPNGVTASKNGFVLTALPELYDNTAIYEVEYIPLEPYKVSTHTTPIEISYRDTLGGVVEELVNDVSDLEKRVLSNESVVDQITKSDYAKKTKDTWKTAVLQNGWAGSLQYRKDDMGYIYFRGSISGGTKASGTAITNLPNGYFSPNGQVRLIAATYNVSATGITPLVVYIMPNGQVIYEPNSLDFITLEHAYRTD